MRKRVFIALFSTFFFLLFLSIPAQTVIEFNETGRLAMLARAWGFLKYYHPHPQQTLASWDDTLIQAIPKSKLAQNPEEFSEVVVEMINDAGPINPVDFSKLTPGEASKEVFFQWMTDPRFFTPKARYLMTVILNNFNNANSWTTYQGGTGIITCDQEVTYDTNLYPDEALRLLSLFRFWNVIHYFYPYKYLMDQPWDNALTGMIPKFINAGNDLEYALSVRELTASIDDSHAFLRSSVLGQQYWGMYFPPFLTETIENKIVITVLLKSIDTLQVGDVILNIDGTEIKALRNKHYKYLAASNSVIKERELNAVLFRSKESQMQLGIDRLGSYVSVQTQRIDYDHFYDLYLKSELGPVSEILDNNIGYIHMGRLTIEMVDSTMRELMSTRAIIFDIRNYPKGTLYNIAYWLNTESIPFVKCTCPNSSRPGFFIETDTLSCGPYDGTKNTYQGKVILLFNEKTQSHAEFTCMALQTAPDVTSIGSQTAGADGNVTSISLPGGFVAYFTGLGIYYPDGRETQRIGIVPDIVVRPTIQGIRHGVDEVLQRAIDYIEEE